MRRIITSLFACACLMCMHPLASVASVDGVSEISSVKAVAEETYPTVNNLLVNSYEWTGTYWKIELVWEAPTVSEETKIKNYDVKFVTVDGGVDSAEDDFTNSTVLASSINVTSSYNKTKALAKYKFRVYVNYTVGGETKQSPMAETDVIDLTDETSSLLATYFKTIAGVKNALTANGSVGTKYEGKEVAVMGQVKVTGVSSSAIYLADATSTNAIKLVAATGQNLPAFTVGMLLEKFRFKVRATEMPKCYVAEYVSSENAGTTENINPDGYYYVKYTGASNIGQLAMLKSITLKVDKNTRTATVTQEDPDSGEPASIKLVDPSNAIYADDFVVPEPADIIFYVDLEGATPVLVLRSIEDIKQGAKTSFATIASMKEAGTSDLTYKLTGDVLVTGKSIGNMGTLFFGQDETGSIMFQYNGGVGPRAEVLEREPQVGDLLVNMRGVYDADYGFSCNGAELKSENNRMPEAIRKDISEIAIADLGMYIKVKGVLNFIYQGKYFTSATLTDGDNAIKVDVPLSIDGMGDMKPDAALEKFNGKYVVGNFNIGIDFFSSSATLVLSSANNLEDCSNPTNLKVDYFDDGKGNSPTGILSWDAPVVPEGVTITGYKVTYQPIGKALKEMSSTYSYRCVSMTSYFYGDSICELGVYALRSDGQKTDTAKITFDFSKQTPKVRGHIFPNISKFKTYGPDEAGNADEIRNSFVVTGVYPEYCYLQENGGSALKVFFGEKKVTWNVGDQIEDLKGVFVVEMVDGSKLYTVTYVASSPVIATGKEVKAGNNSISNIKTFGLASEFAKLGMFNAVTVTITGETATMTQGDNSVPLIDPTGKIFEQGFVIPAPATVIGFIDKDVDNKPVIVCKEITEGPQTNYATLEALKAADLIEGLEYTVTGDILVGGVISSYSSSTYFLQDETSAIALSTGFSELGLYAAGEAPKAGDKIRNLKISFSEYDGMIYASHELVSSDNVVPVKNATISEIYENSLEGYVVSIENAALNDGGGYLLLSQGEMDMLPLIPTEDTATALQKMLTKTVNGVFFVGNMQGSPCLYLRSAADLKESTPDNISNIHASQITIENGMITVEGASVEVYNAAGCKVAASADGKVSVAGINGMIIIKAVYANGEVKMVKAMVK